MAELRISSDLALPLDAVTEAFGVVGVRGSGKSFTAKVLTEELTKAGLPVCVMDLDADPAPAMSNARHVAATHAEALCKGVIRIRGSSDFTNSVLCKLRARVRFASRPCAPPIVGLFLCGGPAAVFRLVVAIHVLAVNRMRGRWLRPHVLVEAAKAGLPALTDCDSSTAILGVVPIIRVVATSAHRLPRVELRRFAHSMCSVNLGRSLLVKAATRENLLSEMVHSHDALGSAVATTSPETMLAPLWARSLCNNGQPTEAIISADYATSHDKIIQRTGVLWGML